MTRIVCPAGLAVNSSVTTAALNSAVRSNLTAIDSSSGGATLVNSTQITQVVNNRTRVLSGLPHSSSCWTGALLN